MAVIELTNRSFGRGLRRLRERAGLSQEEMVAALRMSPETGMASRWENGHRTPSLTRLFRLLMVLDADFGLLQRAIDGDHLPPISSSDDNLDEFERFELRNSMEILEQDRIRPVVAQLLERLNTPPELEEVRMRIEGIEAQRRQKTLGSQQS